MAVDHLMKARDNESFASLLLFFFSIIHQYSVSVCHISKEIADKANHRADKKKIQKNYWCDNQKRADERSATVAEHIIFFVVVVVSAMYIYHEFAVFVEWWCICLLFVFSYALVFSIHNIATACMHTQLNWCHWLCVFYHVFLPWRNAPARVYQPHTTHAHCG